MDPIALAFYAVVCGVLSFFAPQLGAPFVRMGIGAVVGIAAAAALPLIKASMGY